MWLAYTLLPMWPPWTSFTKVTKIDFYFFTNMSNLSFTNVSKLGLSDFFYQYVCAPGRPLPTCDLTRRLSSSLLRTKGFCSSSFPFICFVYMCGNCHFWREITTRLPRTGRSWACRRPVSRRSPDRSKWGRRLTVSGGKNPSCKWEMKARMFERKGKESGSMARSQALQLQGLCMY